MVWGHVVCRHWIWPDSRSKPHFLLNLFLSFCGLFGHFSLLSWILFLTHRYFDRLHDVTRLHDILQHAFPNTSLPLPHLPGLSYYDRFVSLFSRNQREGSFFQQHLDKYFKELAKIPEVVRSTHLRIFLEAYDLSGKVAFVLGPTSGIGTDCIQSIHGVMIRVP